MPLVLDTLKSVLEDDADGWGLDILVSPELTEMLNKLSPHLQPNILSSMFASVSRLLDSSECESVADVYSTRLPELNGLAYLSVIAGLESLPKITCSELLAVRSDLGDRLTLNAILGKFSLNPAWTSLYLLYDILPVQISSDASLLHSFNLTRAAHELRVSPIN